MLTIRSSVVVVISFSWLHHHCSWIMNVISRKFLTSITKFQISFPRHYYTQWFGVCMYTLQFIQFGREESNLWRHKSLREKTGRIRDGSFVCVLIGPRNYWKWREGFFPRVDKLAFLRPVNDEEVYISQFVAFGFYSCGHNIFYKWNGWRIRRTCPFDDGGYLEFEDLPPN